MSVAKTTIEVYISYSHQDEKLCEELEKYLRPLQRQGLMNIWSDRLLPAGSDWEQELDRHLNTADIVLLLISPDYLASRFADQEMTKAVERANRGEARIIPIILRPCDWHVTPMSKFQALPRSGRAVTQWSSPEEAFEDIARGIRSVIENLLNQLEIEPDPSPSPPVKGGGGNNGIAPSPNPPPDPQPLPGNEAEQLVTRTIEQDALAKNAITDKAVRHKNEDMLGFDVYVQALAEFIASPDTSTPLTIGIDGQWGSGKTSLMRMVQSELEHKGGTSTNFWSWLHAMFVWLRWFVLFSITFPIWLAGKLVLLMETLLGSQKQRRLQGMRSALAYDPTTHRNVNVKNLPWHLRFWAKIAAWHCSMRSETEKHVTVWFNAWKFDQEEQLWAALAIAVMEQIKQRYNPIQRIIFWFRLTLKRFSLPMALWNILIRVFLPLALAIVAWQYSALLAQLPKGTQHDFGTLLSLGQPVLIIGAVLSGLLQVISLTKDPFQIPVQKVVDKPNYKEKVGFLGNFDADFARIVSLAIRPSPGWKPRKLVIFIDDLDRCEPPRSIDIIEGINLFLDSEGCVFVLGMDSTAVIASLEIRYKDVFKKMKEEMPGIVSPGRLFLDKIIQIPLSVPSPKEEAIETLVDALIQPGAISPLSLFEKLPTGTSGQVTGTIRKGGPSSSRDVSPTGQRILSNPYVFANVREAITKGAKLLMENPRQVKRFVNLFRLYVYIANAQDMFAEYNHDNQQIGLNLRCMASWVAWSIRWTEVTRHLSEELQLSASDLRDHLLMISRLLDGNFCWLTSQRVKALYPSEFEWLPISPDENQQQRFPHPTCERLIERIKQIRKSTKNAPSHWSSLPWEEWLRDPDFLQCIKLMEAFWSKPALETGVKIDWLQNMLKMSNVTVPLTRGTTSSVNSGEANRPDQSQQTQKNDLVELTPSSPRSDSSN